jgi:hypothetical protein
MMRVLRLHLGIRSIRLLRGESDSGRHLTRRARTTQWRSVSLNCSVATSMRWRRDEKMLLRRVLPLLILEVCVVTLRRAVNRKICVLRQLRQPRTRVSSHGVRGGGLSVRVGAI